MNKKEKVEFIINTLEELYPETPIPLNHKDNFTLLVSVVLSAQCTDARVNKTTPALFALADNPTDMVSLGVDKIAQIIRPCGLTPMKSNGIFTFSQIILDKHNGQVPNSFADLEALPSVGHKTASVVMSQGFGVPAFPVDTHIQRLMFRWGMSNGKSVEKTEKDAKRLFPKSLWNKLHLQIIFYGREYSPARGWNINNDVITSTIGRKSVLNTLK
jgi:endonuclease-3